MIDKDAADGARSQLGDNEVVATVTGPDQYQIADTTHLDCAPAELWKLLCNWERLVGVTLQGLRSDFRWHTGGPGEAPSTFQFAVEGVVLQEEVYELTAEEESGRYRLRYRALEPALGVLDYDAVLDLEPTPGGGTSLCAQRTVRLEAGTSPEMLVGMVKGEMQSLREHFARKE